MKLQWSEEQAESAALEILGRFYPDETPLRNMLLKHSYQVLGKAREILGRAGLELDRGVKLSRVTGLSDDIALALGASGVRISAIPDKILRLRSG